MGCKDVCERWNIVEIHWTREVAVTRPRLRIIGSVLRNGRAPRTLPNANGQAAEWSGIRRDWIKVRQKLYVISFSPCIIHRWNDYSTPELRRWKHRFVNNSDRILPISEKRKSEIIEGRRRRNKRNATEKREDRLAWLQDTETTRFEASMDEEGKRRSRKGLVVKQGKAIMKEDWESGTEKNNCRVIIEI